MVGPPSFASGHRAKKKQKRSDRMKNKNEVKKKDRLRGSYKTTTLKKKKSKPSKKSILKRTKNVKDEEEEERENKGEKVIDEKANDIVSEHKEGVSRILTLVRPPGTPGENACVHQEKLGPQSLRRNTGKNDCTWKSRKKSRGGGLKESKKINAENRYNLGAHIHSNCEFKLQCFNKMLDNEKRYCGNYAVIYHSYSQAYILYEIHAAVASIIFGLENCAPLPRLLLHAFDDLNNAEELKKKHQNTWRTDHDPRFRQAAICASTSLLSADPEASPYTVWDHGYHVGQITGFVKLLLTQLGISHLKSEIVKLCKQYDNGKPRYQKPGKLLQIFVRRDIINSVAYAAQPMGHPCRNRRNLQAHLAKNVKIHGQVRVLCHPKFFLRPDLVKIFPFAADEGYHKARDELHGKLVSLILKALRSPGKRARCFAGIQRAPKTSWYTFWRHPTLKAGGIKVKSSSDWDLVFGASFLMLCGLEIVLYLFGWKRRPIKSFIYSPMRHLAGEVIFPVIKQVGWGIGERSLRLFNSAMFSDLPAKIAETAVVIIANVIHVAGRIGRQVLTESVRFSVHAAGYLGSKLISTACDFAVFAWKSM